MRFFFYWGLLLWGFSWARLEGSWSPREVSGLSALVAQCSHRDSGAHQEGNLSYVIVRAGTTTDLLWNESMANKEPLATYRTDEHSSFGLHSDAGISNARLSQTHWMDATWVLNLGNLFVNEHHLLFAGGRLVGSSIDLVNAREGRLYLGIYQTKEGQFQGGILRFEPLGFGSYFKVQRLIDYGSGFELVEENMASKLRWAVVAPGMKLDGEDVRACLQRRIERGDFRDPRHYARMGIFYPSPKCPHQTRSVYHGMSVLARSFEARSAVMNHGVLNLPASSFFRFVGDDLELLREAYRFQGYQEVSSLPMQVGEFRIQQNSHISVDVILKPGLYPHAILGLTDQGDLFLERVSGLSGRSGETLLGLTERLRRIGLRLALLTSNGADAWILNHGKALDSDGGAAIRLHTTSALIVP